MKIRKNILIVCSVLLMASLLNGCGTIHGFGKDVSRTGHAIQRTTR
ncbi:MAG: entericidin A/B family lipoprotein [Legionella sp.]|nr:entericidin A/B family lipoprotein [Legionella sp.]